MDAPVVTPDEPTAVRDAHGFTEIVPPPAHMDTPDDVPGAIWITLWVCLAIVVLTAGVVR